MSEKILQLKQTTYKNQQIFQGHVTAEDAKAHPEALKLKDLGPGAADENAKVMKNMFHEPPPEVTDINNKTHTLTLSLFHSFTKPCKRWQ